MMDAFNLTRNLGGKWKNGRGQAPCPICQPERRRDQIALSITEQNGKLLLYCFKSQCSFVDIAQAANLPLGAVKIDCDAHRDVTRKQAEYQALKLAKARALWDTAKPINGTMAETYLRARGITCPLPETMRFAPDIYHSPSGRWCAAMMADVSTGGVHRTYFTKQGKRLTKNVKMMLGPCAGGAVRLFDGPGPLVVAEGLETAMALASGLLSGPATVWAALSTSGMKALKLPRSIGKLTVATDGDDPGRSAGDALAARAVSMGWNVSMLPAPDGKDWADILAARVAT